MTETKVDFLCKGCGQAFSIFLEEMAKHNATITCPSCGHAHEPSAEKIGQATDAQL